ncbi:MAG: DUF1549 and DUF1553 domain-containing protein [Pirellulaceae bacterium]
MFAMVAGFTTVSASELDAFGDITFDRDVMAVLSKAGCNAGTCHGNANGKGGFMLSLRGQAPEFDYQQLVQVASGRRINRVEPEKSLALLKATAQVPHGGGKRFDRESPEYRIFLGWIERGLSRADPSAESVERLEVAPADRVLWGTERECALKVVAHFSDGSQRDVTRLAVYEPADPLVQVTVDGVVQFNRPTITMVLVRYLDQQIPVRLTYRPAMSEFTWQSPAARNFIDERIFARLRQLKINPAPLAEDRVFVRRAHLDVLGVLPTAEEAQAFIADPAPDKRDRLIDALLERPEFADMWALKWSDLVRNEEKTLDAKGVELLHQWMRQSFADDKPLSEFVRELIASRGSTYDVPPANFWRAHREPLVRAETTAQVFLGVRLQCARCHNHPFDSWSQDEYYQWASIFAVVDYEIVENDRKDKFDKHEFVGEQVVQIKAEGTVTNARTGLEAVPRFLGCDADIHGDRLQELAAWITRTDNDKFARAQANRIWYHLMGRGIVEPVDDLRSTNPPSHPQLLDDLAKEFATHEYRVKHLVRTILQSNAYQLSSRFDAQSVPAAYDEQLYGRAVVRRLSAEQILDAQSQLLGVPAEFEGYAAGTRAGEIAGVERVRRKLSDDDQFLRLFGKPERLLACDCERRSTSTLGQALSLVGSRSLDKRLKQPDNCLGKLLADNLSPEDAIRLLFWTALTRDPTAAELAATIQLIEETGDRRAAMEDVLWSLLNAKEMLFRY